MKRVKQFSVWIIALIGLMSATNTLQAKDYYGQIFSGVEITDKNRHDIVKAVNDYANENYIKGFSASGKMSYEPSTQTLIMEDLTLTCGFGGTDGIALRGWDISTLNIELKGNNTINCQTALIRHSGTPDNWGKLSIKGSGTLTVNCKSPSNYCCGIELGNGTQLEILCKELCINSNGAGCIGSFRQKGSPAIVWVGSKSILKMKYNNSKSDLGAFVNVNLGSDVFVHKPAGGQYNPSKHTVTDKSGTPAKEVIIAPASWKSDEDETPPTPGSYQSGYPKAVGTTIELKWTRATDNVTAQANLQYAVKWKKKGASDAVSWSSSADVENMTSYTITGLEPNTEYIVNVAVRDKEGNSKEYGEKTVKTQAAADTQAPTGGSYEAGYPKAIGKTIEVKWTRATDNVTAQANLQYVVEWKKKGASGAVAWDYSGYVKDMTSYTITGLEPNTEYIVNVAVRDKAGNSKEYGKKTVKTPAGPDKTPPTAGGYEAGYPKAISAAEIEVKWKRGSDNVTAQKNLRYAVKWKKNGALSSWIQSPITKDITSYTLTGLEPKTRYIVNVVVEDEAGNSKWYGSKLVNTQAVADKTPPAFNAGAKLNVDNVTETSVTISWPKATDDHTPQNKIRYEWSIVGPLCAWPLETDIDSHTFTHLTPGKTYRFQVRAGDEAGNWNTGLTTEVTTKKKATSDTEQPYFPNGQDLSVTATETSLSLSWPAAADKVTATSNLKYTLFFKRSGESVWPGTRLGKNVLKHTCTGLLPDTEYDICVTVYDEAANGADYTWALKTKTKASVKTVHPASVTIAPASFDLEVGNKAMPTATVLPINAADKTVTWSSNNTAVASVDPATGEVTALAPGKAEITATANDKTDGTKWNAIEVRVKAKATPKLVTDVAVMPAAHILNVGDIFYYTGIVQPDDATDNGLIWTSSDPTVATITSTGGFVDALQAGTVTITATAKDGSGRYGTGTLTIKNPSTAGAATSIVKATGIVVDQPSITLAEGGTATLSARILPSDATNKGYTWSSSDPEVASVSNDGVVTAHRAGGSALITATADDGGWTDFCAIHIKGTSVMLAPSAFTLEPGESLELKATTDPWDSPMTKSFSSNRPSVAQVDKGGMVKAVAEGEAIITVTLSGGQKATCRISVQKSGTIPDANETIVDQSAARAWTANGTLYIVTDKPADVEVLNFSGLRLKKLRAPAGTTTVSHLPQGLYIVRVGERTTKVMVK